MGNYLHGDLEQYVNNLIDARIDSKLEAQVSTGMILKECAICLSPIYSIELKLPCNHNDYHYACLARLTHFNCPLCRLPFNLTESIRDVPSTLGNRIVKLENNNVDLRLIEHKIDSLNNRVELIFRPEQQQRLLEAMIHEQVPLLLEENPYVLAPRVLPAPVVAPVILPAPVGQRPIQYTQLRRCTFRLLRGNRRGQLCGQRICLRDTNLCLRHHNMTLGRAHVSVEVSPAHDEGDDDEEDDEVD